METILILHTNGDTSYIDVLPTHNLSDARAIIQSEFDPDQLPSHNFQFRVNGLRVSNAQEKRHIVADINRDKKKVELVPRLAPLPVVGVNNITPSHSVAYAGLVNHHVNKQESTDEPAACMDPSNSTVSGSHLFGSIDDDQRAVQVNNIVQNPSHKTVQRSSAASHTGILPQKRPATTSARTNGCKKNRVFCHKKSTADVKIKEEYDSERYVDTPPPSQNSSLTSDGPEKTSSIQASVKRVELKRTVEMLDLCDSNEEDSKPAAAATAAPTAKDFTSMNGDERKVYWSDEKNLALFFEKTLSNLTGAECEVCAETGVDKRCNSCGKFYHGVCVDESCHNVCFGCKMDDPQCHLCNHKGGIVVKSCAKPGSMKKWKGRKAEFQESLFGKGKFCHTICGMFNPLTTLECSKNDRDHTVINCSGLVMSNGNSHVLGNVRCQLCGLTNGTKVKCDGCNDSFHVTCARQAGLEVADGHPLKCFKHLRCQFVLRARLEDMLYAEKARWSTNSFKPNSPMHWNHAASMLHFAIDILRTMGWAWRWAGWWVEAGDNWQPFLDEEQDEDEMTDEELGLVPSTPESRALDARRCRLEDFGAALRNRVYDCVEKEALERALTIVLSTRSLVGPLKKEEIEFLTAWLCLAYQSKSQKLGFGVDKIPASNTGFCVRKDGKSLKHELGTRRLPGKNTYQSTARP